MKFREIFRFEFGYQVRRPWPWLFCAVLIAVCFLMTRDGALADALYEDFFVNSPFAIAKTTVFGTLMWLLLAAPVAGEAAARDRATGMHPLFFTAPVHKADYLGGRFIAALFLNALILLGVQLGVVLAVYSPGVAAALVGPVRPAGYLAAYAFISLPTAFAATAIQFWFAVRSGRAMASYVGSMLMLFMGFFVASLLLFNQSFGALVDPIGIRFVVEDIARLWTPIERNTRLVGLEGIVLWNRVVWICVGVGAIVVCYVRFRFEHPALGRGRKWFRKKSAVELQPPAAFKVPPASISEASLQMQATTVLRHSERGFGVRMELKQTIEIAWDSFRTIAKSWTGIAMMVGLPALTILIVIDQMDAGAGQMIPTTAQVLRELTASLSNELSRWVIVPLLTIFLAGELVWREREAGLGEITDAMPGSEWPPFLGKFLGLSLVLAVFMMMLSVAGMLAQVVMGYHHFEIGLYLKVLLGLQLPEYLLFALLAFVVHVVVNEKYIGHLVAVMAYVFIAILASMLGIEHNLLVFGAGPGWAYTPIRGFASYIAPWLWFKAYWAAWALLLAVVARLLWTRGREKGPGVRMRWARRRFAGATKIVAAFALTLIVALGAFIFYNTNILNHYVTAGESSERRAEYERRYGKYEGAPQPELTGVTLKIEIYPAQRSVETRGSYKLVNRSAQEIDSIHVAVASGNVQTRSITFDRAAKLAIDDPEHAYRIYAIDKPLKPGDSLQLNFEVLTAPHGFRESGVDGSVAEDGTGFTNAALPAIGYQRSRGLTSANERREHGLAPRPVIASLYDAEGSEPASRGGGVAFQAVMGTSENQVAVAPGALRRTWTENGRRYFDYAADAPIGNEWYFFSAKYAVREFEWKAPGDSGRPVAIRILHDPEQAAHLDRITASVRASLDYYTQQFGPYPYRHLTIVEHPGAPGTGLHADASMISYGEGFPLWIPKDEQGLDFPYAVVAHEMGHQWTLPYAAVEGAPFISEGLAWYSAMQVVKASRGKEEFRRLLASMREPFPYAPIRRGEPLLRALDPYLSYRRGPFAMYALSEYVGADSVNRAIRRLIEKSDLPHAKLVTTLDLYRELKAVTPDSLQSLLHDLFEINAYWLLDTEQAKATQTAASAWQVSIDVRARKMVYDSAGAEAEVPMDQWVEIGVFGMPNTGGDELSNVLYLQKHRIHSGKQTITVTVPTKPDRAGIDPRRLLIEGATESRDKLVTVKR